MIFPRRARPRCSRRVQGILALARVQALLVTRYPVNFAASLLGSFGGVLALAWALQMFAPAGGATAPLGANAVGTTASAILFYGYLLFIFLSDSFWRIGHSIREEQLQGTIQSLYVTPAPRFAILAVRALPLLAITALGGTLACLAANLLFGRLPAENLALAGLIFACAVVGTAGLGCIFACYILLAGESSSAAGNFLEFTLLFVCAMFFPFQALPAPVLWISRLVPLSYCVDAFRSALLGFPAGFPELAPFEVELAVAVGYAVLMPLLSYLLFRWTMDRMRKSGKLGQG